MAYVDFEIYLWWLGFEKRNELSAEAAKVESKFDESDRIDTRRLLEIVFVLSPRKKVLVAVHSNDDRTILINPNSLSWCARDSEELAFNDSAPSPRDES